MKKIIILNHDPLIQRIKDGFCIDFLKSSGFDVTYVDLSNFYFPALKAPYELKEDYVIKLSNEKEIIDYLKSIDLHNTLVIAEAIPQWKSRKIYKYLSDKKANTIKINIYPSSSLKKSSVFKIILKAGFKKSFYAILFRLYRKLFNIKLYDQILSSNIYTSRTLPMNHPDYETFLKSKDSVELSEKYIVFLDEAFPIHPEIVYWAGQNLNNCIQPYRDSLKKLFDYLEKTFNKKVIICAHPKANYKGDEFGHHLIVNGDTAKYVRQSAFVLMHVSSSVSYAILNNKPIIILSSSEYKQNKKSIAEYQATLSNILNINIQDIYTWRPSPNDIKELDPEIRNKFIYSYLTSEKTENQFNSELIMQVINK